MIAGAVPESLWPLDWKHLLAYITGSVAQELLTRNEYLAEENRTLWNRVKGRLRPSDAERITLAKIGRRLGPKGTGRSGPDRATGYDSGLAPETGGPEFDGSKNRFTLGAPAHSQVCGRSGVADGPGQSHLGLQTDCRRVGQSWAQDQSRNRGQHLEEERTGAGSGTRNGNVLDGFHSVPFGGVGGLGFFLG